MLIGFIGAPCSGKTTTAALVFAALKNMGKIVEFVPECARAFICTKRRDEGLKITLNDWDQTEIAYLQSNHESLFLESGTDIVLTDSSIFNTLLYMTSEFREDFLIKYNFQDYKYDFLFHCPPIFNFQGKDPNRLHDYSTSLEIEKSIHEIIKHPYITVTGSALMRSESIIRILMGFSC